MHPPCLIFPCGVIPAAVLLRNARCTFCLPLASSLYSTLLGSACCTSSATVTLKCLSSQSKLQGSVNLANGQFKMHGHMPLLCTAPAQQPAAAAVLLLPCFRAALAARAAPLGIPEYIPPLLHPHLGPAAATPTLHCPPSAHPQQWEQPLLLPPLLLSPLPPRRPRHRCLLPPPPGCQQGP